MLSKKKEEDGLYKEALNDETDLLESIYVSKLTFTLCGRIITVSKFFSSSDILIPRENFVMPAI